MTRWREQLERGGAFATTRVDALLSWGRRHSLALYPFVRACCAPEFDALLGPRHDLDRFGVGLPRFAPRHADLLVVAGTLTRRQGPLLERTYQQMLEPKWVLAAGACACSGGPYDNYATLGRVDSVVPVDVYVAGCPPRPEAFIDGLLRLQARIGAAQGPSRREERAMALPLVGGC